MGKGAIVSALCVAGSMLLFALAVPTARAQGLAWGTPWLLETDSTHSAWYPEIAVDSGGNATAVWSQYGGVWSNRFAPGKGWGIATPVAADQGDTAYSPTVAAGPGGGAVAVWSVEISRTSHIWSSRYAVGTGWRAAELLETNATGYARNPQVAVDPAGNALAVWYVMEGDFVQTYSAWSNRYAVGRGWGTAEPLEADPGSDVSPQVAVDPAGNGFVVWEHRDGRVMSIRTNRYVPGAGWGSPELVETDDTGNATDPQVAVDAAGNALAVWSQEDGRRTSLYANRYVVGTGWGTAELVETNDTMGVRAPQIAVNAAGDAAAVWEQVDATMSRTDICANRYVPGAGWGTAELIEGETERADPEDPQVAVDPGGNATAVWGFSLYAGMVSYNIWSNRYAVGVGWGTPRTVAARDAQAGFPQIAVGADGVVFVVWQQMGSSAYNDAWANEYGPVTGSSLSPVVPAVLVAVVLAAVAVLVFAIYRKRRRAAGPKA